MKLDTQEVERLCYNAKRGKQNDGDLKRFLKLQEKFSGTPEFEKARVRGQAMAMSEVNPSYGFEYWVEKLSRPIEVSEEKVFIPDFESTESAFCVCEKPSPHDLLNVCMECGLLIKVG